MSETLVHRGDLVGHGNWVTAIATSPETPDAIVTASRGTCAADERMGARADGPGGRLDLPRWGDSPRTHRLAPLPAAAARRCAPIGPKRWGCARSGGGDGWRRAARQRPRRAGTPACETGAFTKTTAGGPRIGGWARPLAHTDKTLIVWSLTREEGTYGIPRKRLHGYAQRLAPAGVGPTGGAAGPGLTLVAWHPVGLAAVAEPQPQPLCAGCGDLVGRPVRPLGVVGYAAARVRGATTLRRRRRSAR